MNLILMYGGRSCEHDISIVTAKQTAAVLDGNVTEVYLAKDGRWLIAEDMPQPKDFCDEKKLNRLKEAVLLPNDDTLYLKNKNKLKPLCKADVAVLCFHGVYGEDGCVQGLLELSKIPYTSCGVTASAVGMDKITAKYFLKGLGMPVVESVCLDKMNFKTKPNETLDCAEVLGYPIIIKPSNLGSSIGISVCKNREELEKALRVGFEFDCRVLAEKALTDFCDVNISAFVKDGNVFTSLMEKPMSWSEFLSFEDKYMSGAKGMADVKRQFPFECKQKDDIARMAKEIYIALGCKGVIRIDFLLDNATDKVYVNELNTIPGSMAFYLWKDRFDFKMLMKIQIEEAIKTAKIKDELTHLYKSNVLSGKTTGKK